MKKLIALILLAMVIGPAYAAGPVPLANYVGNGSGAVQGSNQVVKSTPGLLYSAALISPGAVSCVMSIYDQSAGPVSGNTNLVYEVAVSSTLTGDFKSVDFSGAPIRFQNGIVISITNSGTGFLNYQ